MITAFSKEKCCRRRAFTSRQEIDVRVIVFVRGPRIVAFDTPVQAKLPVIKLINTTDNMKTILGYL